ncbi:MAG: VanW family protein [Bacillota bacterium]
MKINSKIKIAILSVTLAFIGALTTIGVSLAKENDKIVPGVYVQGGDLSGLTREKASEVLLGLEKDLVQSTPLVLRYEDRFWLLKPHNIGLAVDTEKVLDEALGVGRKGSPAERWRQWRKASREGLLIPLYVKADRARLDSELDVIASEITTVPRDAYLKINPDDTVEVVPSVDGIRVDSDKVSQSLVDIFKDYQKTPEIKLSLIKSSPKVSTAEIAALGVDGILASFTTTFNQKDTDRSYNVKTAASALEGMLIKPSEVFSFNEVVGPRSTEAGYKNAKVIINNELVDGLGGGVCQVSSTLYNVVLLANFEIIDRANHSIPVAYVAPGRDATVTDNYLDFRFKNTTPNHVYIKTLIGPGRITIKLYGNSKYRKQVLIRTKVIETIPFKQVYEKDPTLKEGEVKLKRQGSPGLRVLAERVVLENGQEKVQKLPASLYHPVSQIVLTGPGVEPVGDTVLGKEKTSPPGNGGKPETSGGGPDPANVSGGIVPPAAN